MDNFFCYNNFSHFLDLASIYIFFFKQKLKMWQHIYRWLFLYDNLSIKHLSTFKHSGFWYTYRMVEYRQTGDDRI